MRVRTGLEVLLSENLELLRGKKVALICNPASVGPGLRHAVDLFHRHPEIELTTILGPQHGARGETQDNMIEWEDYRDPGTGLPVYSLYGRTRTPTSEMLSNADAVVFDVQDVGARYYTFIYTMALAMQACGRENKEFLVLDRPNPINGLDLEGPVLDPGFSSFVGLYPLPIRHGMTVAELAFYFNTAFNLGCRLGAVPMRGWKRGMFFDETGLPWVFPSPNMPALDTSLVYPGLCLLEGTNVSEGRGTTRPFELSGAPWVRHGSFMPLLQEFQLEGCHFRPVSFIPTFHKWGGQMVSGVQIHITDRSRFRPFRTGLALLKAYRDSGKKEFRWLPPPYEYEYEKLPIDILFGTDTVRHQLEAGADLDSMEASWQQGLNRFKESRSQFLLYPEGDESESHGS